MGGHEAPGHHQLTGISKYFNSVTLTGRRNCVAAVYGTILGIVLYFKFKPKKQAAIAEK